MNRGSADDLDALESERAEIDRLFALPLDRFTAARDELSARMRREGKRQLAARIKALKKPTVPVWAVDQLARLRPEKMQALVRAGDALRQAQGRVLAGAEVEALREASKHERALVSELTRHAASILERAGFSPSPSHLELVRQTLRALASASEADRRLAARGWLSRPLRPASFGELLGEIPAPTSRKRSRATAPAAAAPARPRPPAKQREEAREGFDEQARRRSELRRLVRQARQARGLAAREAESSAREAEALEREVEALGMRARQLEREAQLAGRAAEQARSKWEKTRAAAAERRKAARESARRLDRAQRSLEALDRPQR